MNFPGLYHIPPAGRKGEHGPRSSPIRPDFPLSPAGIRRFPAYTCHVPFACGPAARAARPAFTYSMAATCTRPAGRSPALPGADPGKTGTPPRGKHTMLPDAAHGGTRHGKDAAGRPAGHIAHARHFAAASGTPCAPAARPILWQKTHLRSREPFLSIREGPAPIAARKRAGRGTL